MTAESLAYSKKKQPTPINPFVAAVPPPGVVPASGKTLAMDSAIGSSAGWAAEGVGYGGGLYEEGLSFIGYPY
ncbi:MAG: hypothetical protein ACRYGG_13715, partial [Janthinobacterium lividum]